jgi:hypothetical protein
MECWVHQDIILDDDKAHQSVKEAWEHKDDKDELKIELQGLERQFWLGTEAGRLGCYDFSGETWAGDGSAQKAKWVQAVYDSNGRINVLWSEWAEKRKELLTTPRLAAVARTLPATPPEVDLLYLCDTETG